MRGRLAARKTRALAEVLPELVTRDADGQPFSVRYDLLGPLLINEMQRQQRQIRNLQILVGVLLVASGGWITRRSWLT